jgi:glycyl-tRNA synthetase
MPYFIAVRNGGSQHLDVVTDGNEQVIRARFADAAFFIREDLKRKLEDYLPRLSTLTFQVKLGSMLDKSSASSAGGKLIRSLAGKSRSRCCAPRRSAVQGRPGDQYGGRDDLAAGRDGPLLRAAVG